MTEGRKDDAGKPRPTLVMRTMANALQQVLAVAEYGARKYSPDNWLQVPDAVQRYTDAMLRHQQAHLRGEVRDPESGLPHMAHAAWCALAVLELGARKAQPLFAAALSDRAALEERWGEDARLYWRGIDWGIPQRRDVEAAELSAAVGALRKDVAAATDLAEVSRQLRKDPEVRRILNTHGTRLVRTASGSILAGNVGIMGPERTPAEYRKGRKAIRRLERATNPLASLVRGLPLYEAALAEGLLYLHGPTAIAIKDRRGQKVREVHGNTLLSAWALLQKMPDVENLLKLITARVPERPSREEYWRAELAKDPKDPAITHWLAQLSRDPICAALLATRQLQLIHEPRTMLLKFRNSMFPLHRSTAAKAISWVHDGCRT